MVGIFCQNPSILMDRIDRDLEPIALPEWYSPTRIPDIPIDASQRPC